MAKVRVRVRGRVRVRAKALIVLISCRERRALLHHLGAYDCLLNCCEGEAIAKLTREVYLNKYDASTIGVVEQIHE